MRFWVYILQSESTGRYYCGQTNSLDLRVAEHNDPNYRGTKTTKRFKGPWRLVWKKERATRSAAMMLERRIKKRGICQCYEFGASSYSSKPKSFNELLEIVENLIKYWLHTVTLPDQKICQ